MITSNVHTSLSIGFCKYENMQSSDGFVWENCAKNHWHVNVISLLSTSTIIIYSFTLISGLIIQRLSLNCLYAFQKYNLHLWKKYKYNLHLRNLMLQYRGYKSLKFSKSQSICLNIQTISEMNYRNWQNNLLIINRLPDNMRVKKRN